MANTSISKSDLIKIITNGTNLSKTDAQNALSAALEGIQSGLQVNQKVTLVGFGTFSISARGPRKGRNPQTGAEINIPASNSVKFKPGTHLKSSVN